MCMHKGSMLRMHQLPKLFRHPVCISHVTLQDVNPFQGGKEKIKNGMGTLDKTPNLMKCMYVHRYDGLKRHLFFYLTYPHWCIFYSI